jgi:hypothetical protein
VAWEEGLARKLAKEIFTVHPFGLYADRTLRGA